LAQDLTSATTVPAIRSAVPRASIILVMGLLCVVASIVVVDPRLVLGLRIGGAVLVAVAVLAWTLQMRARLKRKLLLSAVSGFVENDASASFVTDSDGALTYSNAAAAERFRGKEPTTLGQAFQDLFANPGAVLFRLQSKAFGLGAAREDIVTRRGHVRLSVHRLGDSAFLWRLEEISDRAQSGRANDNMSLPMLTAGPSGTVLFMNEAFRRLVGGRVKSLDRVFTDLPLKSGSIHRVDGVEGSIDCLVAEVPAAGGRSEIYLLPADGPASGVASGVAGGWSAVEDLPVPLLKVAASGEILASNQQARDVLEVDINNKTRLSDVLEGLGRPIIDWLDETAAGRGNGRAEFLRGTGDRQSKFVQVSLNLAKDAEGPHIIAVLTDATAFKSLEEQFTQSQKMQAIGQLAGGVAHDFNNLLTAISGHCDLLLLRHDQGDQDYSDLIQIHQNANRAGALVGQLLAFSRKQNLRPEVLDLRDTLADLTHLLNRLVGETVRLTLNHEPGLGPIRADKRQLEQVLMNLVVNARDAMPRGGEIKIKTEMLTLEEDLKRDRATVPAGAYISLKVIDEGTGIDADKIDHIFEPFFTTKRVGEGTGLGLSTVYGIVKQTGGFIFVDSQPDKGTTFALIFPLHDTSHLMPEAPESKRANLPEIPAGEIVDGVVLLVEDEAPVRAFASRALRLRGYTVLEADSAEAALETLSDPDLNVDIFVTDVIMPGKDGPTWVREALNDRPNTKVVFVSGYAEDAFGENQANIPNSVFLPKPFSLNDLTATVHQQLLH